MTAEREGARCGSPEQSHPQPWRATPEQSHPQPWRATSEQSHPRRGRQAEAARNDMVVLAAAREVFAALGADAPVSAVAERAGVGIGSLYRRYGSKDDLLRHLCLLAMRQSIATAEEALGSADPWGGLTGYIRAAVEQGTGSLAPLAGAIETTPELWDVSRRGRELLASLVERAQKAGALRQDVTPLDIAHLVEMFGRLGPVRAGSEEDTIRLRLLTIAIDGLRAGQTSPPLPDPAPTSEHYERRWAQTRILRMTIRVRPLPP